MDAPEYSNQAPVVLIFRAVRRDSTIDWKCSSAGKVAGLVLIEALWTVDTVNEREYHQSWPNKYSFHHRLVNAASELGQAPAAHAEFPY